MVVDVGSFVAVSIGKDYMQKVVEYTKVVKDDPNYGYLEDYGHLPS